MIYEYDNYTYFLKETLNSKAKINPSYSLRAFAKKLDISPSSLSLVLNRKKNLSVQRGYDIAKILELTSNETEYFITLIQIETAKSDLIKFQLLEKMKKLNPRIQNSNSLKEVILSNEHFKLISDWYGLAIYEFISKTGQTHSIYSIVKAFNLNKLEVELTIERLLNLNLIIQNINGTFSKSENSGNLENNLPAEALKNYFSDVHNKSMESVIKQSSETKVIATKAIAIDPSLIEKARELTDLYISSLEELSKTSQNNTEVYQVLTNFFKLTNEKSNEISH